MNPLIINSDNSLHDAFGILRELYTRHKYLKLSVKIGKSRSLDQNSISHAWYEQLAQELREDTAIGWKAYCKLHFGIPILRAEDAEFNEFYNKAILRSMTYEQKIQAMKFVPVTSLMTKTQLSQYLETMQEHFRDKYSVMLEFPKDET